MGHHPIVATDGGLTIKKNGQILGGLGVAGGTGEDDQEIAVAALRACEFDLEFSDGIPCSGKTAAVPPRECYQRNSAAWRMSSPIVPTISVA